jgi:dienelactone hydrolase
LAGILSAPANAAALVIFVREYLSTLVHWWQYVLSRFSVRNTAVANALNEHRMATLLFDLLKPEEERNRVNVFDIDLLSERLLDVLHWAENEKDIQMLPIGLFGASTGAAAALVAAAKRGDRVGAVVSRGGRPDLAGAALASVRAPVLLIVGGDDFGVIELNEAALAHLNCPKLLHIVPGATHLFEEPGTLEQVTIHAARWFEEYLCKARPEAA